MASNPSIIIRMKLIGVQLAQNFIKIDSLTWKKNPVLIPDMCVVPPPQPVPRGLYTQME